MLLTEEENTGFRWGLISCTTKHTHTHTHSTCVACLRRRA